MRKFLLFATFLCGICTHAETLPLKGNVIKPSNPNIQYIGRVSMKNPDVIRFNYPGTQIIASFEGTSLKMIARPESGYFMAQIDKAAPFKVGFNAKKDSVLTLATALADGKHTVHLMYIIEGLFRQPEFHGFILDEGCSLTTPPTLPERKIEFIGNSITCGYGVESITKEDLFEDETENHYYTYATLTAQALNAQHTAIARSGIGVYRNYDGPKTGNKENMPWQYEYTLFNQHDETWDFSRYQPQLVCINLGTNDLSTNNFDIKRYENAYRGFLKTVRQHYPNAKIVLLTGPMLGEKEASQQRKVLDSIRKDFNDGGDKEVYRFDFTFQTGDLHYGASWHPSYWQHQKMAGELIAFLRPLMNWY
ncbi:MAG: lipase [Prevotella sp.]|nr:lipase [Prevotella sp.]